MTAARLVTMGKCYMEEYDYEMAYRCFLDAALQNNADAILNLGIMYLDGSEVLRQDFDDACHLLQWSDDTLGVQKSSDGTRMNELSCHETWAKKIRLLGDIYGIADGDKP